MLILIKKKPDGSAALSCRRADGSTTWQRQAGAQGQFFPRHDLSHYAVEAVLGRGESFYGLVSTGWDLTDFHKPYPRGTIPPEAVASEVLVGLLDQERAAGTAWSAAEINRRAAAYFAGRGVPQGTDISDAQLAGIRELRSTLFSQWDALVPGDTLELTFPCQRPA